MMFIKDEAIKAAFVTMMNKLIFGCKQVLVPYYDALRLAAALQQDLLGLAPFIQHEFRFVDVKVDRAFALSLDAQRVGELISVHVIPRPHPEVEGILPHLDL